MSHGPLAGIVWWGEWSRIVRERWWRFPSEARESKSNRGGLFLAKGSVPTKYDGSGELSGRSHKQNYATISPCQI